MSMTPSSDPTIVTVVDGEGSLLEQVVYLTSFGQVRGMSKVFPESFSVLK